MTTLIPPTRDLPPVRLSQRRDHLIAEIARQPTSRGSLLHMVTVARLRSAIAFPRTAAITRSREKTARPRRQTVRTALLVAALLAAVVVASPAFGLRERLWDLITGGTPVSTTELSDADWTALSAVALGPAVRRDQASRAHPIAGLDRLGFTVIRRIASVNGRSFYVLERSNGPNCYAVGRSAGAPWLFGQVMCQKEPPFPSQSLPILDLSVMRSGPSREVYVSRLEGFASDAVASVGIMGTDGVVRAVTPVVDNAYEGKDLPIQPAERIVAFDAKGSQIHSIVLTPLLAAEPDPREQGGGR